MKTLLALFFGLVAFACHSQEVQPLVVINGAPIKPGHDALANIPVDLIESLTSYNAANAVLKYGEFLGANGMVVVKTKFTLDKRFVIPDDIRLKLEDPKPVIVVDGKITEYESLNNLNAESVAQIQVIKDGIYLVEKYGTRALNGVVLVTTK